MKTLKQLKILVVDDDESVRNYSQRLFKKEGFQVFSAGNGRQAVEVAKKELPDLILLDVVMPEMDGYTACQLLRQDMKTRFIPVIILSTKGSVPDKVQGLNIGADDYLSKPCDPEELKARVQSVLLRSYRNLSTNPLTKLPGNPLIEEEVNQKIRQNVSFAFAYIDIDHFKPYNDIYGFQKGDQVILFLASLLLDALIALDGKSFFAGHIGGDDFVLIGEPSLMEEVARQIAEEFDRKIPEFYSEEDRNRGYLLTRNRQGELVKFPLLSLSIAIVSTENRKFTHYGRVVELASEMKRYAKSFSDRNSSWIVKDRRKD